MKKGVIFTILTYFIFSVILSLILMTFAINKASNTELNNRLAAFKTMYQGERVISNLESVLNHKFSTDYDNESIYLIFDSFLRTGMNPKDNLLYYEDFLNTYNNKTPTEISYDFSAIKLDLNDNQLERIIQPFEVHTIFDYSGNTLTITNVQVLKSIGLNLTADRDITNKFWTTPSGDFYVYLITNGAKETKKISNSNDGSLTVQTEIDTIYIDFNFASSNNIVIRYSNVSNMHLNGALELSQLEESLFMTTSPYNNIINISLGRYSLVKEEAW